MKKSYILTLLFACCTVGAMLAVFLYRDDFDAQIDIRPKDFSAWRYTESKIHRFIISPNDECFAVVVDHPVDQGISRLIVVDRRSGRELIQADSTFVTNLCFDSHGRYLAAFMFAGLVVYDLQQGGEISRKSWQDIGIEKTMAMGFSSASDFLIMQAYSVFGFDTPSSKIAFRIPSGKPITEPGEPVYWYGDRLSADGSKWWVGGHHGPTPRVFDRNNEFIGYCMRWPNIRNAWFARDSQSLVTQHNDGTWIRWDLAQVVDRAAVPVATSVPGITDTNLIALMNTEDSILAMEEDGNARLYPIP